MKALNRYLVDKDDFNGVAMIRLAYNGGFWDYTKWRISDKHLFFFNQDMRVGHILWISDPIKEIDNTHITVDDGLSTIGLELFYGGATP